MKLLELNLFFKFIDMGGESKVTQFFLTSVAISTQLKMFFKRLERKFNLLLRFP